ncbi:synaptobrevin, partial [Neocallimastix californiae]
VDEVVGIMQDNIQKVMDRGERLDTLQVKTEDLQQQSSNFKRGANRVRKQMWWKDMKLKIILGVIVGLIILFILSKYTEIKYFLIKLKKKSLILLIK